MKTRLLIVAILFVSVHASPAAAVGATWLTKDTTANTITGKLGPAAISITNILSPSISASGNDFSTVDYYSGAPLGNSESAISNYQVGSNYTATFSMPVSGLMIYARNWRGNTTTPFTYKFNHPVVILSGFASSTTSGNTLTVPVTFELGGIILFTEPVQTLTVTMNTNSTGGQIMTFGVTPRATVVAVKGSSKPKTTAKTYTLRGTADATYGIKSVTLKIGTKKFKAKGTATWSYRVKLTAKRTPVQIQATSNTGEKSAIKRVTITKK